MPWGQGEQTVHFSTYPPEYHRICLEYPLDIMPKVQNPCGLEAACDSPARRPSTLLHLEPLQLASSCIRSCSSPTIILESPLFSSSPILPLVHSSFGFHTCTDTSLLHLPAHPSFTGPLCFIICTSCVTNSVLSLEVGS